MLNLKARTLPILSFFRNLNLRRSLLVVAGLMSLAFVDPKENDLVELQEGLNLRSSAKFRPGDQNILRSIPKNSRGIVRKIQRFEQTDNYGLCIEFVNVSNPRSECSWVYYNTAKPAVKLFDVATNEKEKQKLLSDWQKGHKTPVIEIVVPHNQSLVETQRRLAAILDQDWIPYSKSPAPSAKPFPSANPSLSAQDIEVIASQSLNTIARINSQSNSLTTPRTSCPDGTCNTPRLEPAESCSISDSYQEKTFEKLINSSSQSEFFKAPQKEIITLSCIQRNMRSFPKSSAFYRSCLPGQKQFGQKVQRACVSDTYLSTTAKAFNLVAECLGDYVVGYDSATMPPVREDFESKALQTNRAILAAAKQQAALSIFSFMAQESGMHINAQSGTGAGGPGQMTGPAIETVNNDLKNIRAHLQQNKSNPYCSSTLLRALDKPLSQVQAACDRKNPENILQTFSYTFAYQRFIRRHLEDTVFEKRVFGKLVSTELSIQEKDRFMMELTAWAHNTGPGGMARPLAELLKTYSQNGQKIRNASDIDRFLIELSPVVGSFNSSRRAETANYYNKIQEKMKSISPGGRDACLAN